MNERKSDIRQLATHFITKICEDYGHATKLISDEAFQALEAYNWTGNIRELRNVIERLVILCGDTITGNDVTRYVKGDSMKRSYKIAEIFEKFGNLDEVQQYINEAYDDFKDSKPRSRR